MAESKKLVNSQFESNQPETEVQAPIIASKSPDQPKLNQSNSQKRKQMEDLSETESKAKFPRSNDQLDHNKSAKMRLLTWNIDGLD